MIKLEGIWMAPWGIAVGFNYFGQSGYAYARSFLVEDEYGMSEYQGEPLGSQRTPFLQRIDVRCEKSFTFNKIRPKVFIEVFNLMNANTATAVGATYGNPLLRAGPVDHVPSNGQNRTGSQLLRSEDKGIMNGKNRERDS